MTNKFCIAAAFALLIPAPLHAATVQSLYGLKL
jgi:hypothetical protein